MQRTPNLSDEELMDLLAANQLDAAAILFQRYRVGLYNFFLRQGIAREASEDLVQSIFERVIKYRQSFRHGMAFKAWLYQIARNVKADFQRQGGLKYAEDISKYTDHLDPGDTNTVVLEQEENLIQMEKAMQQLPKDHLEILLLTRYQRMKYAEVAELLGCSEGAVKQKVFRALQQLRSLYFNMQKL